MAKQTSRDRIIEALEGAGYRHATTNSRKYIKLQKGSDTLWIGKNGAVRCGKTLADSFSISDAFSLVSNGKA